MIRLIGLLLTVTSLAATMIISTNNPLIYFDVSLFAVFGLTMGGLMSSHGLDGILVLFSKDHKKRAGIAKSAIFYCFAAGLIVTLLSLVGLGNSLQSGGSISVIGPSLAIAILPFTYALALIMVVFVPIINNQNN